MKIPRANKHDMCFGERDVFAYHRCEPRPFDAASSSPPTCGPLPLSRWEKLKKFASLSTLLPSPPWELFSRPFTRHERTISPMKKRQRTQRKRFELISRECIYRLRAVVVPEFMLPTRFANNRLPQTHFSIPYHRVVS